MRKLLSLGITILFLGVLGACSMVINKELMPKQAEELHSFPLDIQGVYKIWNYKDSLLVPSRDKLGGTSYMVLEVNQKTRLIVSFLHVLSQKEWDNDSLLVLQKGFEKTDTCLLKKNRNKFIHFPFQKINHQYIVKNPQQVVLDATHNLLYQILEDSLVEPQNVFIRKKDKQLYLNILVQKKNAMIDSIAEEKRYETLIVEEDKDDLIFRMNIAKKTKRTYTGQKFLGIPLKNSQNYLINPSDAELEEILLTNDWYPKGMKFEKMKNEQDFGYTFRSDGCTNKCRKRDKFAKSINYGQSPSS